jgi:hypothetical protein
MKQLIVRNVAATNLVAAFALVAVAGWGGSKERDWQAAKLLDPDRTHYFSKENLSSDPSRPGVDSSVTTMSGYNTSTNTPGVVESVHDYYIVQTQDQVYLAERLRLKSAQKAKLVVTRPVKFAIEKNKLYLMNENGEEYQTKIVKQMAAEKQR